MRHIVRDDAMLDITRRNIMYQNKITAIIRSVSFGHFQIIFVYRLLDGTLHGTAAYNGFKLLRRVGNTLQRLRTWGCLPPP